MINQSTVNLLKTQLIKQCKNSLLKYIPITGLAFTSSLAFASTLNAVFTPADVGPGSTAKLTYTITNSAGTVATNTDFTAVLPTGLLHATPANAQTNCSNGTLTAPDGGTTLTFADYDIAAASSCTVSLNVIAPNTAGTYTLPAINITSSNGSSNSAAIGLDVLTTRPGITIAASPSSINVGGVSTLTFTIDNSLNASRVGNLDTSVNLPSGLVVADVPNASTDCVSGSAPNTTITAQAGSSSITLDANGSTFSPGFEVLAAGALCTLTVDVKASGLGEQLVETNSLLADFTDSGFATTNITSTPAFALMSFAPNPAVPGGSTELNIALTNYNRSESATNIAFTDDLNAVVAGMQAAGLPLSVCGGTLTGSPLLSFAGGTIGPGETCSFKLPVTIPAAAAVGNYTNTTSSFTFDLGSAPQTWNPVSHNLAITQAPTVTLELLSQANLIKEPIAAGDDLVARYTITNIDTINAAGGITFYTELTNALPFPVSASLPAAGFCGAGSAIGFTYPSTDVQGVTVTGGAIPAGGSCTFDVIITVPDSQPAGIYSLKAENGSATIDGETPLISDTSDTFTVVTAPSLSIALPGTVKPGDSVDATFTLTTNANSENVSDIAFTVDLNSSLSGLVVSSFSANTCSEAPTGTSMISIAAVTLASASSCSFVATLDIPASAPAGTYAISSSTVSATVNGAVVTSPSASVDLKLQELSLTMNVADAEVVPGATTQLDFTLTNVSTTSDLTSIAFTSNLSAGLSGLAATSLPVNPCGGTISGTTFLILSGASLTAGDSCSFSVEVQVPGGAADGSYDLLTSEVTSSSVDSDSARAFLVIEQDLAPSVVSITSTKSPLAGTSPIPMEIVFSEEINSTTFVNSDLLVSNGSVTNLQEVSADKYTFDIIPSADGVTITAQLPAGVVADLGGSALLNTASSVFSIDYDTSALPSAVIDVISGSKTSSETLSATVTYANATQVFLTNDKVNLLFTGSASTTNFVDNNTPNPDVTILNGASSIATIQVSNIIGDGTLTIGIDEQTARNDLGNVSAIADSTNSFSIDNTAPTVAITSSAVDPINGSFIANFDFTNPALSSAETSLTGFDVNDVILNNANISNFSGSNGSYSATITPVNDGVVTININADAAQDDHGNGNIAAPTFTIHYDGTKPDVSISSVSSLNNGPFEATITFTESVTGFSVGAISASNANLSNFTSVSGSVYTVDVAPIVDGTVTLDIATDSVVDAANNGNTAAAQFSVSYDATPPSLDITGPITAQSVAFTATFTFSESVTGFGVGDIVVGNGSASNLQGSGAVYTALITPASEGGVTVDVASSVAADVFGNGNTVATQFSVQYDSVQPSIVVSGPVSEQNSVFTATFTFSEDVTGFDLSDISVSNGTASNLQGSGSVYTAFIGPLGDGLVSINVAQALVSDMAGNTNTASNQLNVMYDTTQPTLDITGPSAAQNTAFTTTFTFSESVTGFALSDIVVGNAIASDLQGTGTTYTATITPSNEGDVTIDVASSAAFDNAGNGNTGAVQFSINYDSVLPGLVISGPTPTQNSAFTTSFAFSESVDGFDLSDISVTNGAATNLQVNGNEYTALITPIADGTVSVDVAAGAATDVAGNSNTAASQFSVLFDGTAPTVVVSGPSVTQNTDFTATVTFSENVSDFTIADIQVGNGNASNLQGSGSSYSVTISPSSDGLVIVNIGASAVLDGAGNGNTAAQEFSVNYDVTAPTVVINGPANAQNDEFVISVNFSENISGLALSDFTVSNAVLSNLTGSGANYSLTVNPSADGTVSIQLATSTVNDAAGNDNSASNQFSVDIDITNPTVTLSATAPVVNAPFEIVAQFSEVITGLSSKSFAVTGATIDGFSVLSITSFKVKVVPTTVGKITVSLPQNSVTDLAGNTNFASNQLEFEYSNEAVSVSISAPQKANASFESVIDFSTAVSGFELSDIQSTNADVSGFKSLSASSYSVTVSGEAVGDITLRVIANAAIDKFGNGSTESQTTTVAFDNKAPNIVSRIPLNNSDNVSVYSDFTITFDESIVLNSGEVKLVNLADNSVMTASNVNVVGNSLEFAFDGDLNVNTRYQLMLDPAIVRDEFGNAVGGITDWFFTTSNTAPRAENDDALTQEDLAIVIDVAANDTDSDGQLDLGSLQLSQPSNGVASVKGAGLVEYKPNQNFNGVDSFTYTIADNSGVRSNEATVSVEITSVNDAPNFESKPVTSVGILSEYQYQIKVSDIDSETLTITIVSGPDWLSLNDQLLQGTVPASVNGQSFEITLEVSDGELTEQQQFTLNVVEFDESLVSIVQGVNVSPILVQEVFELRVMISNASTQSIALEQLLVALEGVEVVSAASGCTFNESSYLCQEMTNIDAEDSLELVFTLRGESAGELTSVVALTYNQELTKQDTFVQVIAEDVSDEKGNKLPLSDVNSFALADFNSDGLIDIAFAANSNSAIFINQGAGKYELGASFLANEDVKHIAVADFNNDGTFDIAFATESELGSGVLYNDGNLVFTDTQIVSSIPSQWVFTFDINADALNDIILLDDSDNGISIITQPFAVASLLNNTVRQSNAVIDSEAAFNDLATGDFDNNGLIDLVLAVDDGPVEIWYQGDNGQFDIQQTQLLNATKLKVFDLNADGILEVVAITEQGLEILDVHNQELQRVSSVSYLSLDIAYLNGNQSPEIVILSESGNISIFEFTLEGYALLPVVFEAQQGQDIALTDVDLDGDLDLIISSSGDDNEVRFNQGNGMFGEQTTDLVLVSTPESNSLVEGDSFEWNLVVSNQGLANAISPEVTITSDNVVISEIESELLTCSVSDTGVICQYDGELVVEQETSITVSLLASNLGTASVNAYVSNITVDDNHDNNSTQLTLDVSAKPPVVIPEPPKKKSSGGGSYLLVIVIFFLLRRVR